MTLKSLFRSFAKNIQKGNPTPPATQASGSARRLVRLGCRSTRRLAARNHETSTATSRHRNRKFLNFAFYNVNSSKLQHIYINIYNNDLFSCCFCLTDFFFNRPSIDPHFSYACSQVCTRFTAPSLIIFFLQAVSRPPQTVLSQSLQDLCHGV